jgi:prolyl-tRNA editing enzyme YbaK/EbsC (Cys-tRNA(Pro) deacylase)
MTIKNLNKSAQVVQDALYKKGFPIEVVELDQSARTAHEAASAIGCDVAQIVKSLLFHTKENHHSILILVSGSNRVNEKTIESLLGEKILKADADFTRAITGFAIGGIPPVGHKQTIHTILIDEDLLHYEKLWAAAGTPHAVFCLPSHALPDLTGGRVVTIK